MIFIGTTGGEIILFSLSTKIYRANMPISSNGLLSMVILGDYIYIGSGDGKLKKLSLADGKWNLTHEAQLDSKVMSLTVSTD
jgi:hypothetical protein